MVNDGSKDQTKELIEEYQEKYSNIKLIHYDQNRGKGFAVKSGVSASRGQYILFTDADNSTPIEELKKLQEEIHVHKANIGIGSRYLTMSNIQVKQPFYRIALGRIGNFLIRLFLLDDIRDTQCGFKLFEHAAAKEIFALQRVHRFGFDMEILTIAKSLGYKIIEIPVSWFNSSESRVRPVKDAFVTLKDLVYVKLNAMSGRYHAEEIEK